MKKSQQKRDDFMPFSHFSRIFAGTTLSDLKKNNKLQEQTNCKKLEFTELTTITLSPSIFDCICNDISKPSPYYKKYTTKSIADINGKWKCIVLKNNQNSASLIIYTGGRSFPLYAAIIE